VLTAISRYGARVLSNTEELVAGCKARGEFIRAPQIAEFEADGGRRAAQAMQISAHFGLRDDQIERVARVVRGVLEYP
jgi:hypothetical protein